MTKTEMPKTLLQATRYFSNLDTCRETLAAIRWPNGVTCPMCGSGAVLFLKTRKIWKCATNHERRQFSVKVGTIFEDSPIGLDKWFIAMWLLGNCKNGISSLELHRSIKVTQKTAWLMLQRIRLAMQRGSLMIMGGDGGAVAGRRLKYQELSSNQGRATHRDGLTTVRQQRGQRKGQG